MWKVMSLCDAQLTDVNPADILNGGLYRRCNTYKGGGGYDKFPEIYDKRFGKTEGLNDQFVVQLRGCPLSCPYCYVTKDGVWTGKCTDVSTEDMVQAFVDSGCNVFHLMGGAPALYIDDWKDIITRIGDKVFHSDLMLVEGYYKESTIRELAKLPRTLYAVSIKGADAAEFYKNTATKFNETMFFKNLDLIVECGLPCYLTFTGMSAESVDAFKARIALRYNDDSFLKDSFAINLVHYNALDYKK